MGRFVVPLTLLAAWWAATASGAIKSYQLASPRDVVRELGTLVASGMLWRDIGASVERVALGFAIALCIALVLGSVVGSSRAVERALDPTLQAIRAVPSLAWVPLILLWLGIGETAKITLVAIGAFFPIYVSLVAGIRGVDRKLIEVGQTFGLSRAALVTRVLVPATLPQLLVGARIGSRRRGCSSSRPSCSRPPTAWAFCSPTDSRPRAPTRFSSRSCSSRCAASFRKA